MTIDFDAAGRAAARADREVWESMPEYARAYWREAAREVFAAGLDNSPAMSIGRLWVEGGLSDADVSRFL